MTCLTIFKDLDGVQPFLIALIRTYNILMGIMNITGNTILIWALRKTGQTTSLSLQFIIIMSSSDIIGGSIGLAFTTLLTVKQYLAYCWLKLTIQFTLNTFNLFSIGMVFLIALDRYLHMRYLERYSLIVTKRRGYSGAVLIFLMGMSTSTLFVLPFSESTLRIMQVVYFSFAMLFLISIILLYHEAMSALKRKASQITRNIVDQNRALSKAGKRISFCVLVLIAPVAVVLLIEAVNAHLKLINASALNPMVWFASINLLGNGFCSCVIFISQNVPIKGVLQRAMRHNWNRIQTAAGAHDRNA